jgi:biotin carboxyl carrier protein
MKTRLIVGGSALEVEFRIQGREVEYRILREQAPSAPFRKADIVEAEPGIYSILWEGNSFDVRLEQAHYGTFAQHRSTRVLIEKPAHGRSAAKGGATGPLPLKAPMPGRVVRLLVAEGDSVEKGQGVAVLEAMKMQNEITAPRAGVVRRLTAQEGKVVAAGEIFCVLE